MRIWCLSRRQLAHYTAALISCQHLFFKNFRAQNSKPERFTHSFRKFVRISKRDLPSESKLTQSCRENIRTFRLKIFLKISIFFVFFEFLAKGYLIQSLFADLIATVAQSQCLRHCCYRSTSHSSEYAFKLQCHSLRQESLCWLVFS